MEVARHWRNGQKNLDPADFYVSFVLPRLDRMRDTQLEPGIWQQETKQLQVGAMLMLVCDGQVFLTKDKAKPEMTGNMKNPVLLESEEVYCLPAGAQDPNEALTETVWREMSEETGVELPQDFKLQLLSNLPFVTSQFGREEGKVSQFGVYVFTADLDGDSKLKQQLDGLVKEGQGKWFNLEDNEVFNQLPGDGVLEMWRQLGFRPQTVVAALLYLGGLSADRIKEMNHKLIEQTKLLAGQMGLERKNGVFREKGDVAITATQQLEAALGVYNV